MFKLMDRVPDGIQPMLTALEEHIYSAGLGDMVASADTITQVCVIFEGIKVKSGKCICYLKASEPK